MHTIGAVQILGAFLFALVGLTVGSFLNVCIDRLPRGESVVRPPSHCDGCQRRLGVRDLIPVISYLQLRGRCRHCGASIPRKLLWVELVTGAIFGLLFWRYGLSLELGVLIFYACLFIIIFVIDLEHQLILNRVVYPAMVVALLLALAPLPWLGEAMTDRLASAGLGAGVGFFLFLLLAVISRGGMGWGDVKLAGLIGLATGFPLVVFSVVLAAVLGILAAAVMAAARRRKFRQALPFGPFLAVSTMITLVWGSQILGWYQGLMPVAG